MKAREGGRKLGLEREQIGKVVDEERKKKGSSW